MNIFILFAIFRNKCEYKLSKCYTLDTYILFTVVNVNNNTTSSPIQNLNLCAGVMIVGDSGTGKTSIVEHILNYSCFGQKQFSCWYELGVNLWVNLCKY